MMGDSETECSYSPTECSSPILYAGTVNVACTTAEEQSQRINVPSNPVHISQQEFAESFVESQFQASDTQILSSQALGTLDALAGLDSLLDNPLPLFSKTTSTTLANRSIVSKQLTRAYTQPNMKARSLDLILAKVPTANLDKYELASKLDAQDMKLLINTCGQIVSSKSTKSTLCDQLIQLIECGTFDKVFRSVGAMNIQTNRQSDASQLLTQTAFQQTTRESQMETNTASQVIRTPAQRTLSLPPLSTAGSAIQQQTMSRGSSGLYTPFPSDRVSHSLPAHNAHQSSSTTAKGDEAQGGYADMNSKAVVVGTHGDAGDWVPVTDVALLHDLNAGTAPAAAVVQFGSDQRNSNKKNGAYFAEQPSTAWQACDTDLQQLLEASDASLQFRRMLQRLARSIAGKFSGIRLRGASSTAPPPPPPVTDASGVVAAGPGATAAGETSSTGSTDSSSSSLLLESLRAKLLHLVASAASSSISSASSALLSGAKNPVDADAAADAATAPLDSSALLTSFDALKLVVFRQDKLGLSLVKQASLSGMERVVIQSKNQAFLDPSADRLLNVGDELVTVQGATLQAISISSNSNSKFVTSQVPLNFSAVMERIKQAPRPLQLGFVPPGTLLHR